MAAGDTSFIDYNAGILFKQVSKPAILTSASHNHNSGIEPNALKDISEKISAIFQQLTNLKQQITETSFKTYESIKKETVFFASCCKSNLKLREGLYQDVKNALLLPQNFHIFVKFYDAFIKKEEGISILKK